MHHQNNLDFDDTNDGSPMSSSTADVEAFNGKIVYNLDGSAYIIDTANATDSSLNLNTAKRVRDIANATTSTKATSAAAGATTATSKTSSTTTTTTTATATTTKTKLTTKAGELHEDDAYQAAAASTTGVGSTGGSSGGADSAVSPKIHSFRVVSAHDAVSAHSLSLSTETANAFKIQKPILMCFICKLSFGNTKSFSSHANSEHSLNLKELEKQLLNCEYSSAIIQRNMDEKPQISFLEPLDVNQMSGELLDAEGVAAPPAKTASRPDERAQQQTQADNDVGDDDGDEDEAHDSERAAMDDVEDETPNVVREMLMDAEHEEAEAEATSSIEKFGSLNSATTKTNSNPMKAPSLILNNTAATTATTATTAATSATTTATPTTLTAPAVAATSPPEPLVSSNTNLTTATATTITTASPPNNNNNSGGGGDVAYVATSTDNLSSNKLLSSNASGSNSCRQSPSPMSPALTEASSSVGAGGAVSDFLQQQLQQCMTSPLGGADSLLLHQQLQQQQQQQQQQQASFQPPQPTATSLLSPHNHFSSLHASLAAALVGSGAANDPNAANGVKLISEFLQQQLSAAHQEHFASGQQQQQQPLNSCPDHPDYKGIDCKTCELIGVQQQLIRSPLTPQRSPNSSAGGGALGLPTNLSMSPTTSVASVGNAAASNAASSFTIGACSEHINGRPQGMDCARCEMILNSARLNSGVQMSTRNSCKTLKCPQCNWHYKYQETLEIHMREKHPDGESACGYCLAGQQHPRLARGESYSCGYKPYRCEICNYSTTTKGNLSIHMQSDKHLNNMQELNSSQNMVAAAAAAAAANSKLETAGNKLLLANNMSQAVQAPSASASSSGGVQASVGGGGGGSISGAGSSGSAVSSGAGSLASSKPKPSFRCDICSYETSVARNLRIHMTSEKHTHNMAVLQNNIKQIQAFNFLQQQQQQQQQQAAACGMAGGANSFLPEVALADLAYNQAIMIQLLHQNAAVAQVAQAAAASHQLGDAKTPTKASTPTSPTSSLAAAVAGSGEQPTQQPPTPSSSPFSFAPKPALPPIKFPTSLSRPEDFRQQQQQQLLVEQPLPPLTQPLSSPAPNSCDPLESTPTKPDMWPTALYSCLVCDAFNTNNLDELNQHLLIDRSRQSSNASAADIMLIHNNNYICRLCNYKTNLKANFQLHSKTDKHLQKLNYINHIREGGPRNEYKLQFQQQQSPQLAANSVQLKCNCCDFYTNSIQKLSLHTQHMRHDTMRLVFHHLVYIAQQHQLPCNASTGVDVAAAGGIAVKTEPPECQEDGQPSKHHLYQFNGKKHRVLLCQLCNFNANTLLDMIQHVKSLRHVQVEQFICLQRRSENLEMPGLEDVFKVTEQLTDKTDDIHVGEPNFAQTLNLSTSASGVGIDNTPGSDIGVGVGFSPVSSTCSITSNKPQMTNEVAAEQSIVYKCNHCDYFVQFKKEMESHIEVLHPNVETDDYLSIPTNAAALHAFKTAVAAATLAAVQRCNTRASPVVPLPEEDDCPAVVIKKERADDEEELSTQSTIAGANDDTHTNANANEEERTAHSESKKEPASVQNVQCPLCQDNGFTEKQQLELHLMRMHSVNRDGLARLLQLVDNSVWQNMTTTTATSGSSGAGAVAVDKGASDAASGADQQRSAPSAANPTLLQAGLSCQQCEASFKHEEQLLQHAQQSQHYALQGGDYLCLAAGHTNRPCHLLFPTLPAMIAHYKDTHMSLVISERHVYKYRCKQCSLAFKTQQKLTTHMLYHTMRDATKCALCQRSFRSTQALQKHMEQAHAGECGSSGSPRVVSPSLDTEAEKPIGGAAELNYPETTNIRATEADNVGNKLSLSSSPSPSPSHHMDVHQESKDLTMPKQTAHIASPLSPPTNLNSSQQQQQQQQQHIAAITAALLKQQQQQQQQQQSQDVASDILQHLQMEPTLLNQKFMQQNQQQLAQHFSNMTSPSSMQNIQNLQSLQQIQQLPQLAAAAAASGMPLNPVDMLNLMQFHHLMSLNFMNLAPPLIFGANANATGGASGGGSGVAGASAAAVPNNCNVGGELQKTTPATGNATNVGATTSAVETAILPPQAANSSATNAQQIANNQKRARTRITDDQLKILRAHFDINNSPSEESIMEMSQKANLPMKVVKHWFRNTLFKERQRNKDSPYNFNNPPSTTLNLEEYERTGQTKVLPLMDTALNAAGPAAVNAAAAAVITTTAGTSKLLQQTQSRPESTQSSGNISDYMSNNLSFGQPQELNTRPDQQALLGFPLEVHIKTEPGDEQTAANSADCDNQLLASTQAMTFLKQQQQRLSELTEQQHQQQQQQDADMQDNQSTGTGCSSIAALQQQQQLQQQHQHAQANNYETKSESGSSDVLSRPQTPNSTSASNLYNSMNELLSQQLENMNNMGPPKKFQLNKVFEKNSPAAAQFDTNSNSSNSSSTSSGKRANRTRFTDYQIKVLQEFFENNSYPKDSDLEYLSKLLLLSPRVIVVWFQNARQKQRKIYENQPNNTLYESEEKKQNINYACKKCNLVFQRYYELIRHQKNHCFKEENNKKSAKAQIAAAQIAQNLSSEDSNSSMDIHHHNSNAALLVGSHQQHVAAVAAAAALASAGGGGVSGSVGANLMATSPQHLFSKSSSLTDFSPSTTPTPPQRERSNSLDQQTTTVQHKSSQKHECDKCKMCFSQFEQLREHQLMHLMNPGLFGVASGQQQQQQQTAAAAAVQDAPPFGPFGSILQSLQQAAQQQQLQQHILQQQQQQQQQQPPPPAKKRKYSETSSNADDVSSLGEYDTPSKKYDFLYQYFMQNEVNTELKQQFLAQQQQQPNESEFEMDFLANYYQQTELKKRSNYDFLYQYYMKSEDDAQQQQQQHHQQQQPPQHHHQIAGKKPSIDFLLQYYQLNESKKFFQLGASAQRTHDGTIQASSSSELPTTTTDDKVAEYSAISEQSGNNNNNNNNNNNDGDNGNTKQDDIDKSCTNNNNNNNNNSSVEAFENNEDVPMQAMDEAEAAQTETIGHESPTPLAVDNNCAMKMEKNNKRQCKRKAANSSPIAQNHHYFQNLEDFLDASMTENTSETLTFGDEKVTQLQSGPMAVVGHESPPQPMQQQQQQFKIDDQKQQQQTKQNKRLRTTILPEQLNFLYECYQTESNPSRKMLEEISKKVNLKKRVVQ